MSGTQRPRSRSRSRERSRTHHESWTPSRRREDDSYYSPISRHDNFSRSRGNRDTYSQGGGGWRNDRGTYRAGVRARDDRGSWSNRRRSRSRSPHFRRSRSRSRSYSPPRHRSPPRASYHGRRPRSRTRSRSRSTSRERLKDKGSTAVIATEMKVESSTVPMTDASEPQTQSKFIKPIPKGPRHHLPSSSPVTPTVIQDSPPRGPIAPKIPRVESMYRSKYRPVQLPDLETVHAAKLALRMLDHQNTLSRIELEGAIMRTRVATEVVQRTTSGLLLYGYTLRSLPEESTSV